MTLRMKLLQNFAINVMVRQKFLIQQRMKTAGFKIKIILYFSIIVTIKMYVKTLQVLIFLENIVKIILCKVAQYARVIESLHFVNALLV